VAAQWNDYGPNATVYSEAYYAWRDGLPALADKQWGGSLLQEEYSTVLEKIQKAIPGQNLDRMVTSKGSTIFEYRFTAKNDSINQGIVKDLSANGYDARTNCMFSANASLLLDSKCTVQTPLRSKGRDYTLSFSIKPHSKRGTLFIGADSTLLHGNGTVDSVMLVAAGNAYSLNYSLPVGEWTKASLIGKGTQTFFSVDNGTKWEFTTVLGVNGEYFIWAPIAIEAPIEQIGGDMFEGEIASLQLLDYAIDIG
jgi:hexosaminidase